MALTNFQNIDEIDAQMQRRRTRDNSIGLGEASILYHYSRHNRAPGNYTLEKMTYWKR